MKSIDVFNVLKMLDILDRIDKRKSNNDNYCLRCPFHKEGKERNASFYIHKKEGVAHCFSCGWRGNIYDLVAKVKNVDKMTAIRLVVERFELDIRKLDLAIPEYDALLKETPIEPIPESFLAPFLKEIPEYMLKRGFSKETLEEFKIGYNKVDNQVVFPIYNENCILVGTQIRNLWANLPKYKFNRFQKATILYGLYKVYKGCKKIVAVEGITDVLRLHEFGYKNTVAIFGSSMSNVQANLLCEWTDRVVLCFDNDEAGRSSTERAIERLSDRLQLQIVDWSLLKDRKDVGECTKEEVDTLLESTISEAKWRIKRVLDKK